MPRKSRPKPITIKSLGNHYEEVFENAPCALFVVNQGLQIFDFNRRAFALFGEEEAPANALLGDALRCENAVTSPGGCGTSEGCPECRFRMDAAQCLRSGAASKSIVSMRLVTGSGPRVETFMVDSATAHKSKRISAENRIVLAIQRLSDWDIALEEASR